MNARIIRVHPTHPQRRLITQAAEIIAGGGVLVSPTDACYSLVCQVGNKTAEDRIRAIRHVARDHYFTLLCADVSSVALYGKVSNAAFRLVKTLTPGPYTFILAATRETPRRLQDPKRKRVGLRVPAHPFVHALLEELGEPLLSSTLVNDAIDMPLPALRLVCRTRARLACRAVKSISAQALRRLYATMGVLTSNRH